MWTLLAALIGDELHTPFGHWQGALVGGGNGKGAAHTESRQIGQGPAQGSSPEHGVSDKGLHPHARGPSVINVKYIALLIETAVYRKGYTKLRRQTQTGGREAGGGATLTNLPNFARMRGSVVPHPATFQDIINMTSGRPEYETDLRIL